MAATQTFKLEELAQAAGVSPRTVRYYVQRGLLPGPKFRGRDTVYDEEHLTRLRSIRRMQEQFLPLDAIQAELARGGTGAAVAGPYRAPAPAPLPRPERWQRFELAPGVELHVSDRAAMSEATIDEIKSMVEKGRNP